MEAMGGPCSGHLRVSQVTLMVEFPVGQLNSLPLISQTGAKSPGQEDVFIECSILWSKKTWGILLSPFLSVKEFNLENIKILVILLGEEFMDLFFF